MLAMMFPINSRMRLKLIVMLCDAEMVRLSKSEIIRIADLGNRSKRIG